MNLNWFQKNLDIVFFFYGFSFVVMGIAIFLQPKEKSEFKIADILWLLALFGLTHGINEFLDMWSIIKEMGYFADLFRWFMLTISYFFLFEFGRRLIFLEKKDAFIRAGYKKFIAVFFKLISFSFISFIIILGAISSETWLIGSIWTRYLLGFPGALLSGCGALFYYQTNKRVLRAVRVNNYFYLLVFSFFAYGVLGGLVVPKANFFPANWLNNDAFLMNIKIPIQVFRAICAISICAGAVKILKIFRWETEKGLRESFYLMEKVTGGVEDSIFLVDMNYKIIWLNKKAKDVYGKDKKDIIGNFCYNVVHNLKNPCQDSSIACPLKEALKTKTAQNSAYVYFDHAGNRAYEEVSIFPLVEEYGDVKNFICQLRDVTEKVKVQKELESAFEQLKSSQAQLIQSSKMASIGQLAAGIAHEINNPLTGVLNNAQLIKINMERETDYPVSELKEIMSSIEESALRCKKIVRSLLDFAVINKAVVEPISVNEELSKVFNLIEQELKSENILIKKDLEERLALVYGNAQLLHQVFVNLIINARWAIKKKPSTGPGYITIKTRMDAASNMINIIIADTGIGISEDVRNKIFEPFFTTKEPNEGVGLGLSIVYNIIKEHKGKIGLESHKGEGAVFTISLPII